MNWKYLLKQPLKKGDTIEWFYNSGEPVDSDETMWSSTKHRMVPIGGTALVVSVRGTGVDQIYTWVGPKGQFSAYIYDGESQTSAGYGEVDSQAKYKTHVSPRKVHEV